MVQRLPQFTGKGCFLWRPANSFSGDTVKIANALTASNTSFVALKIHNGYLQYTELAPIISEIRSRGIGLGAWGYIYNTSDTQARNEAAAAIATCKRYSPDFYLIDAEGDAKGHPNQAAIFSSALRLGLPNMSIGLCSYRFPSLHMELPWAQYLNFCDFVAPQVYWRGYDPVGNLTRSKAEYAKLTKLPYYFAGGDMYLEKGIRPTNKQVVDFMTAVKNDKDIHGTLMWAMDQNECPADLWATYSAFPWDAELQQVVMGLNKFLDDAKVDVAARKEFYLAILQQYKQTGALPKPNSAIEEAIIAGIKILKSPARP
jgi:hypothetical protein